MITAIAAAAVPLILASLGGLLSEKAGVLNIALEGCIGIGAFTTVMMVEAGLPPVFALIPGMLSGGLLGLLLAGVHLRLGANLFIAGLGINLLVPSLADILSQMTLGHKGVIRIAPEMLNHFTASGVPAFSAAAILAVPLVLYLIVGTQFGRRIRAAGNDSGFLGERGVSADSIRLAALVISSSAAALAGGYIALRTGAWVPGISAGRGWISLIIIWLGFRRPFGILISAYFFSLTEIISGRLQGAGGMSTTLFLALPYLAALAALILATITGRKNRLNR